MFLIHHQQQSPVSFIGAKNLVHKTMKQITLLSVLLLRPVIVML